jgi:hypothetical protein
LPSTKYCVNKGYPPSDRQRPEEEILHTKATMVTAAVPVITVPPAAVPPTTGKSCAGANRHEEHYDD